MNGTEQKERQTAIAGLRAEVRTLMEAYAVEWDQTVGEINQRINETNDEMAGTITRAKVDFEAQLAGVRDEFAGLLDAEHTNTITSIDNHSDWTLDQTEPLRRGFWGRLKWLLTGK